MDRFRRGARGLRLAVTIAVVSLSSMVALAPSSSVAAPPPGAFVAASGATLISAVVPASASSTYRSLLPNGIAPAADPPGPLNPNRPSVKLTGLNISPIGLPQIYESYAMLRSRYCGQNGWYNAGDGVNTPFVKALGDQLGVSKYIIDPDSNLGQTAGDPNVWQSSAKLDGQPFVTLSWRRDPIELARLLGKDPWQLGWLRGNGAPFEAPIWDAFPVPGQAGMINWLDANAADSESPPQWDNRVGVVTVTVRQGVDPARTNGSWMSLVPKTIEVPGVLQTFNQGISYVTLRRAALGDCG